MLDLLHHCAVAAGDEDSKAVEGITGALAVHVDDLVKERMTLIQLSALKPPGARGRRGDVATRKKIIGF